MTNRKVRTPTTKDLLAMSRLINCLALERNSVVRFGEYSMTSTGVDWVVSGPHPHTPNATGFLYIGDDLTDAVDVLTEMLR